MPVLECKGLTKRFGRTAALDEVSLTVEPGRIVGLLGPNGSGKTTLIKLANGLLTPDGGYIAVCGTAPGRESHSLVSYLPERTAIHKLLWSVVWFFGIQFALQFAGSLLIIGSNELDVFNRLFSHWDPSPTVAIHVGLLMAIGCVIIYGAIFYAITTFFLKKHLNLE